MPSAPLWPETQVKDSPWAANSGPRPLAILPSLTHHTLRFPGLPALTLDRARYGNWSMARGVSGPSLPFICPFKIRAVVTVGNPIPEGAEPRQARVRCAGLHSRQPRCQACGDVGWTGPAHSPSPKKMMRFLAAVRMGCRFLAVSRASAAWRFQKAGSSSSTGRGERGPGQPCGAPRVWGAAGEAPHYLG